jgi:DNA polymerase IIIc chi subunit
MTVKVGLAKKVGQPDFGSLGASCNIELELDGGLLFNDLEGLQQKIQTAYVACRQAVNDELDGRQREEAVTVNGHEQPAERQNRLSSEFGSNQTNPPRRTQTSNGKHRAATTSQVRALHAIATRQGFNLTELLRERFKLYRAEELSVGQASRLIDDLNQATASAIRNGSGGHA